MSRPTLIFIFLISSISVVISINDTTTSQNVNEISDKIAESITDPSIEEEDLFMFDMNRDDILSTSEMNEDDNLMKDFFVNLRYLKEPDPNPDEIFMMSSNSNGPTTSKSIRIHINTVEENVSNERTGSEIEVSSEDKGDENKSDESETEVLSEDESNENKSSDDAEEIGETRRVNKDENVDDKSSINAEEISETKTESENAKESSEIESTSDSFKKADEVEESIENPAHDDDKSDDHKSVNANNDSDKNSDKVYYKFTKPNDESNSDWDVLDDLLDTRRMILRNNDGLLENARAEKMTDEEAEVSRSVSVPEYVMLTKNDNYGKERMSPANVHFSHAHTSPTRRGNFYNPNVFTIQHVNPIDFNSIVSRYGANILRQNRFMPITRRNDIHLRTQDSDGSAESIELKTIDDFSSEKSSNAYPYTPLVPLVPKISQEPKPSSNYDAVMLKLIQASENTQIGDDFSMENIKYNGRFKNFRPHRVIPRNFGLYNVLHI